MAGVRNAFQLSALYLLAQRPCRARRATSSIVQANIDITTANTAHRPCALLVCHRLCVQGLSAPRMTCKTVNVARFSLIWGSRQGGRGWAVGAAAHRRQLRRRQAGLLPQASAASMPTPESSNGASQPHTNGNGGQVPEPAVPPPLSSSTGSSGGGLVSWFRAQQLRSAELRKRLASLGLAAVLAYGELVRCVAVLPLRFCRCSRTSPALLPILSYC